MFSIFKKDGNTLQKHQYKYLTISLPSNWQYELEDLDIEACFDPNSQSTLRISFIKARPPKNITEEENIATLTSNQPYVYTKNKYILTNSSCCNTQENNIDLVVITWMLIDNSDLIKIAAIITYTILSSEKDTAKEKGVINLIENSLNEAELKR